VYSKETVLYTAQTFVDSQQDGGLKAAAQQQLPLLVRCPHLSHFWLSAAARCEANELLLAPMQEQLLQLLQFLQVVPDFAAAITDFKGAIPDAPSSWLLGTRQLQEGHPILHFTWTVPVSKLRGLCEQAAESKKTCRELSPCTSPPLHGLTYQMEVEAVYGDMVWQLSHMVRDSSMWNMTMPACGTVSCQGWEPFGST
jgi:hypothetical protein